MLPSFIGTGIPLVIPGGIVINSVVPIIDRGPYGNLSKGITYTVQPVNLAGTCRIEFFDSISSTVIGQTSVEGTTTFLANGTTQPGKLMVLTSAPYSKIQARIFSPSTSIGSAYGPNYSGPVNTVYSSRTPFGGVDLFTHDSSTGILLGTDAQWSGNYYYVSIDVTFYYSKAEYDNIQGAKLAIPGYCDRADGSRINFSNPIYSLPTNWNAGDTATIKLGLAPQGTSPVIKAVVNYTLNWYLPFMSDPAFTEFLSYTYI